MMWVGVEGVGPPPGGMTCACQTVMGADASLWWLVSPCRAIPPPSACLTWLCTMDVNGAIPSSPQVFLPTYRTLELQHELLLATGRPGVGGQAESKPHCTSPHLRWPPVPCAPRELPALLGPPRLLSGLCSRCTLRNPSRPVLPAAAAGLPFAVFALHSSIALDECIAAMELTAGGRRKVGAWPLTKVGPLPACVASWGLTRAGPNTLPLNCGCMRRLRHLAVPGSPLLPSLPRLQVPGTGSAARSLQQSTACLHCSLGCCCPCRPAPRRWCWPPTSPSRPSPSAVSATSSTPAAPCSCDGTGALRP